MVYVTHDQVEAMTLADRIVVLSAGSVEQVGTPLDLYEHPDNLFVAGFIGSPKMNFIEGTVIWAGAQEAQVGVSGGDTLRCLVDASAAKPGDKVTLGVRPEHLQVAASPAQENTLATTVSFVESLGSATVAYCSYAGLEGGLTCQLDGRVRPRIGDALRLAAPAQATYLFDASGRAMKRLGVAEQPRAA